MKYTHVKLSQLFKQCPQSYETPPISPSTPPTYWSSLYRAIAWPVKSCVFWSKSNFLKTSDMGILGSIPGAILEDVHVQAIHTSKCCTFMGTDLSELLVLIHRTHWWMWGTSGTVFSQIFPSNLHDGCGNTCSHVGTRGVIVKVLTLFIVYMSKPLPLFL